MTILHGRSFAFIGYRLVEASGPGSANILIFSDGGFWEYEDIGSAGWLAFVLRGHWGDQDDDVHLIAS